jgi:hypothetical protein
LLEQISKIDDFQSKDLKKLIIEVINTKDYHQKIEKLIKFQRFEGYFNRNLRFEQLSENMLNNLALFIPEATRFYIYRYVKINALHYIVRKLKKDDDVNS